MLQFFRSYQKIFYYFITVIIVLSFSFFGTYSAISQMSRTKNEKAFVAIDGDTVYQKEFDQLIRFISTDQVDRLFFAGKGDANVLNDGVIQRDFIETGLATLLIEENSAILEEDLQKKLEKEKLFKPYTHPQASFISAESVWQVMLPDMNKQLTILQGAKKAIDTKAIEARVNLYRLQRHFPAFYLQKLLISQENQYQWIDHDPLLDRENLNLFYYTSLEDWFGKPFISLVAKMIYNGARMAESLGYRVSKEEAAMSLYTNAKEVFDILKKQKINQEPTVEAFFDKQLVVLGLDQSSATRVWRDVLLFRRLFDEVGNSVFVDAKQFQTFNSYAKKSLEIDLFKLPRFLQISDFKTLQKLEVYLDATAKRDKDLLRLPKESQPIDQIDPRLLQKVYTVEYVEVDGDKLQKNVSLKQIVQWISNDENWDRLRNEFAVIGVKENVKEQERYQEIESLDEATKKQIFEIARKEIVLANPKWLKEALEKGQPVKKEVGIPLKGQSLVFKGADAKELIDLLDKEDEISNYSADNKHYYHIEVIKRAEKVSIIPFKKALKEGILNILLEEKLEDFYIKSRASDEKLYKQVNGDWKPLSDVKDIVAQKYFSSVLEALKKEYESDETLQKQELKNLTSDLIAPYRLYGYMKKVKQALENDFLKGVELFVRKQSNLDGLYGEQWNLIKEEGEISRESKIYSTVDVEEVLSLKEGDFSPIYFSSLGDHLFIKVNKSKSLDNQLLTTQALRANRILGQEAKKALFKELLNQIKTYSVN